MLNVILMNAYNYLGRGDEYVAKLKMGISRNLTVPHTYRVLTEDDCEPGVHGWWNKLFMFQPGRFEGRCMYVDLDTVIVGNLDDIAGYRGDFAMISDFYHPQRLGSTLMLWEASKGHEIFARWHNAGKPQTMPMGDQQYIESVKPGADRLQNLFPRQIVSFKAHCGAGIPEGARIVAFHGLPRPHHVNDLMRHW
jgi:hypothetical protein